MNASVGTPVLRTRRLVCGENGQVVEHVVGHLDAAHFLPQLGFGRECPCKHPVLTSSVAFVEADCGRIGLVFLSKAATSQLQSFKISESSDVRFHDVLLGRMIDL